MIMLLCHRLSRLAPRIVVPFVLLFALSAQSATQAAMDANATLVSAETALQRGDCGAASTLYAHASQQLAQIELAARATAVALACGQYAVAKTSAAQWLQLAPGDLQATLALTRAELSSDQIAVARAHYQTLLATAGAKIPETIDALAQGAGSEPTLAMLRELDDKRLHGAEAQLTLAALALDGWDAKLALRYVQSARAAGASTVKAAAIAARAHAILGDSKSALSEAHTAATDKAGRLTLAQSLLALGQDDAALAELQRLRTDPESGAGAARLLAQVAMENGDYAVAEQRCNAMLQEAGSAPLAVYYLGVIAERRGDDHAASRDYALLTGTGFEPQGRRRAAGILYRQGERDAAVRILNAARDAEPDERIRSELAAAELLSVSGAADEAVSRIDSALRRAPGNPEIAYQRAVLLERAGKIDAAVATLETLHRDRPSDAGITNALGFTLADHKRDLPRAEQLIRAALVSQPDSPALLDSLGWVLFRRGQVAAASPQLARAYRLLHDGDIGAHWGEALWAAGQKDAARAAWQRALSADPDNKLLNATVHRYAPTITAPKPPPALEAAPRTSI